MHELTREEILKNLMCSKSGNVKKFSEESGIPYSSIRNIFTRGFDSVNVGTMVRICKLLNVELESLYDGILRPLRNEKKEKIYADYIGKANSGTLHIPDTMTSDECKLIEAYRKADDDTKSIVNIALKPYFGNKGKVQVG